MGYNTDFSGCFTTDKKVDDKTLKLLKGLATTRRMKRDMSKLFPEMSKDELLEKFGEDGEFFIEGTGDYGQGEDCSIVDFNEPPASQPGLRCQWLIDDDGKVIEWDGNEKFYDYVEWIKYLIDRILKPRGYIVNGEVTWEGEDNDDIGKIVVRDNVVTVKNGRIVYD